MTVWLKIVPNPAKVARRIWTQKQMVASFFVITSYLVTVALEQSRNLSIPNDHLSGRSLRINSKKAEQRVNSFSSWQYERPHIGLNKLISETPNIQLMDYPSYNLDLAPNAFFIFHTSKINYVVNDFRQ